MDEQLHHFLSSSFTLTEPSPEREEPDAASYHLDVEHAEQAERCRSYVEMYRSQIGLSSLWQVQVDVLCPADLIRVAGDEVEACVQADRACWYSWLSLRCDVPQELEVWLVCHELCELQMYGSGAVVHDYFSEMGKEYAFEGDREHGLILDYAQREYLFRRNQEIEERVSALLGMRRPAHLVASGGGSGSAGRGMTTKSKSMSERRTTTI